MGSFVSHFWIDFLGRFDGPLHFRLIAQPLMAILLAIRDARRDARAARGAYFWRLVTEPEHRRDLLKSGVKGISKLFVMALALDVVYQLLEFGRLRPMQGLLTATVLAVIPYILLRGPVNRLMRVWARRSGALEPPSPRSGGAAQH